MLIYGCGLFAAVSLWLWLKYKDKTLRLQLAYERILKLEAVERLLAESEARYQELLLKQKVAEEKLSLLQSSEEHLKMTFSVLSHEALERSQRSFLELAKVNFEKIQEKAQGDLEKKHGQIADLFNPLKEGLSKLNQDIRLLEKERQGDQNTLSEQIKLLMGTEKQLRQETANLVKALRTPLARGRWGEIQLRRVVELSGMLSHCDFYEQAMEDGEQGKQRPDLLIRLPGGRQVVVDAKVPLEAFLESVHTQDETQREQFLKNHARQVRAHILALGKKAYWNAFQPTPEFVILFLPAETFFSAALEFDPTLIELGAEQGVILATPTTLIALLRSVAYGWKQENLSRYVEEISTLGHELYKRLVDMGSHFARMGKSLGSSVEAYNKAIGSLESRVLVSARKFKELGAASHSLTLDPLEPIESIPRQVQASEFVLSDPEIPLRDMAVTEESHPNP